MIVVVVDTMTEKKVGERWWYCMDGVTWFSSFSALIYSSVFIALHDAKFFVVAKARARKISNIFNIVRK